MNINPMTPITAVKVLQAVPLDNSYKDTLTFENVSGQTSFFTGKAKATYTNLSPINLYNAIRLPVCADDIYDCNYIMFQNANFKTKWFYAFITKINYVNPNMCQVEFEIDVLQTWYFDYTINSCWVEREHTNDDRVGANLQPEPVQLTEYINEKGLKTPCFDNYTAVILTADNPNPDNATPYKRGTVGGLFSGLYYVYGGNIDDEESTNTLLGLIDSYTDLNKQDSIVSTFIAPSYFLTQNNTPVTYQMWIDGKPEKIGDYTPLNKKLLTYPYNYICVSNQEGQNCDFRYEYFNSSNDKGQVLFLISGDMSPNPEILCYPVDYEFQFNNIDKSLSISGFPQFAYAIDTFRAWIAQSAGSNILGLLGSGAMSVASENPLPFITETANLEMTYLNKLYAGDTGKGTQGSSALVAMRLKNFIFYNRHIRDDIARSIDNYFSIYGYTTNTAKVPNITGRKSWNYVKTKDSKITGSIPFEDIEKIRSIYDNGVTFWHGDYVGHYERDNSIIGG